jgi:hypothetical protein
MAAKFCLAGEWVMPDYEVDLAFTEDQQEHEQWVSLLRDAGLHPTFDTKGAGHRYQLSIPMSEHERALELIKQSVEESSRQTWMHFEKSTIWMAGSAVWFILSAYWLLQNGLRMSLFACAIGLFCEAFIAADVLAIGGLLAAPVIAAHTLLRMKSRTED